MVTLNAIDEDLMSWSRDGGSLFVSDQLGPFPFERLAERECMDTPTGMILFAGRDEGRWY